MSSECTVAGRSFLRLRRDEARWLWNLVLRTMLDNGVLEEANLDLSCRILVAIVMVDSSINCLMLAIFAV